MHLRLRPRFEYVAPCPPDEAARRLDLALRRPGARCRGDLFPSHAVLHIPEAEQRLWSPFLSLDFDWHPEGTLVRGLFGPKPSVWSLFVASYAACAFVALFALTYAWAQWTLGQAPWSLAALPAAGLGALVVHAFARYGQRRGRGQMDHLRHVLDEALAEAAVSEEHPASASRP